MKRLFILLSFFIVIPVVAFASENSNLLYDTIKNEVSGGYAKEYSGEHLDKLDGTGREKIYYWYGNTDSNIDYIDTKRNIIFGGFCWQTIRTTDSGGVKLLYNGIPENGKCLNNRPAATSNYVISSTSLLRTAEVYYADDYSYNPSTGKYKLYGNKCLLYLNDEIGEDYVGYYTFLSEDSNYEATYSPYKILEYLGDGYFMAGVLSNTTVPYNSINTTNFHTTHSRDTLRGAGYMFNQYRKYTSISRAQNEYGSFNQDVETLSDSDITLIENSGDNNFTYDSTNKTWVMNKGFHNYTTNKFKFKPNVTGNIFINYVTNTYDFNIYKNDDLVANVKFSGDSKVVIENVTANDTISIIYKIGADSYYFDFTIEHGIGEATDSRTYFGHDYTYANGEYTLVDTIKFDGHDFIPEHHYYCEGGGLKCTKMYYTFDMKKSNYYPEVYMTAIECTDGDGPEEFLDSMLYNDNVNKKDSAVKNLTDLWFEKNLIDYTDNLEDVVYCNDRNFTLGFPFSNDADYFFLHFHPGKGYNGGGYDDKIIAYNTNLSCSRVTDQFSTKNNKAKLKYPIGLMTYPEAYLLNTVDNPYPRTKSLIMPDSSSNGMWLMTPYAMDTHIEFWTVRENGRLSSLSSANGASIRPTVSLKKGTRYISGSGTQNDPFVIPKAYNVMVDNNVLNGTVDSDVSFDFVPEDTSVEFKVSPRRGFNVDIVTVTDDDGNSIDLVEQDGSYVFMMPSSNVTIKIIYSINVPNTIMNISFGLLSFVMIMICIGIIRVTINIKEKE